MSDDAKLAIGGVITAAIVGSFIWYGVKVAEHRPPRIVHSRYSYVDSHTRCSAYDSKSVCIAWSTYYDTHYVLQTHDGAKCEVDSEDFRNHPEGQFYKCWQLFGWSGGAHDSTLSRSPERF